MQVKKQPELDDNVNNKTLYLPVSVCKNKTV